MQTVTLMGPAALVVTLLGSILQLYTYVIIAAVIMSWLLAFNVVNYHNNFVRSLVRILDTLTEPVFRMVRRVLPPMGGLDLSPIVVLFAVWALQAFALPWFGYFLARLIG
jgi:YggT family protein